MTVRKHAEIAAQKGYLIQLNEVYAKIPTGSCSACTKCCSESVNMSYLEFLNVVFHCFNDKSFAHQDPLPLKMMTYFIFEFAKPMKCPFLTDEKRCYIYDYRPLPCRLFGNATEKAYDHNYQAVLKQNQMLSRDLFKAYGLKLPKRIVNQNIAFCKSYKVDKPMNSDKINAFYDAIVHLDGSFCLRENLSPDEPSDNLVGWFVSLLLENLPFDKTWLLDLRLDVLKAINHHSSS